MEVPNIICFMFQITKGMKLIDGMINQINLAMKEREADIGF
jgi:hypothetical protein